jgi:hypothetical protein
MRFFIGLHHPSDCKHFASCFVSVNTLRARKSDFPVGDWIMDSGAFTTILTHGGYPEPVQVYADQIKRWKRCGNLLAAVAQDYMCEPAMLAKTGLDIAEHQRADNRTIRCAVTVRYRVLHTSGFAGVHS